MIASATVALSTSFARDAWSRLPDPAFPQKGGCSLAASRSRPSHDEIARGLGAGSSKRYDEPDPIYDGGKSNDPYAMGLGKSSKHQVPYGLNGQVQKHAKAQPGHHKNDADAQSDDKSRMSPEDRADDNRAIKASRQAADDGSEKSDSDNQ